MSMFRGAVLPPLLAGLFGVVSCAESVHQVQRESGLLGVPSELVIQIDPSVRFVDLQETPENYVGRMVMLGGIVLGAKRTETTTEIEILELPVGPNGPLTEDRLRSKGRFIAVRSTFVDPATLPSGTPISIVGAVTGSTTRPLDDGECTYPVLEAKHIVNWNIVVAQRPEHPVFLSPFLAPLAPYGFLGSPWGRPYGYFPYSGRFGPSIGAPRSSPPPPPPRNPSPHLRRR
jgi:outer membrane lipoprotein